MIDEQKQWQGKADQDTVEGYLSSLSDEQVAANQPIIQDILKAQEDGSGVYKHLVRMAEATNTRKQLSEIAGTAAKEAQKEAKTGETKRQVKTFESGADRIGAIKGLREAGHTHMAASVRAVSDNALTELVDHANAGGNLLLDNGAFSAFKSGKPLDDADFDSAMDTYEVVATRLTDKSKLTVIAPDVVGDQDATRRKIDRYWERLKNLVKQGVNVILPVQRGELTPAELWADYMEMISPEGDQAKRLIAGIPSNAKAFTTGDLVNLFDGKQSLYPTSHIPTRAHLLGMGIHNSRFKAVSEAIPDSVELTADATGLRTPKNVKAIKEDNGTAARR